MAKQNPGEVTTSSIIDMEVMGDDELDYETNFTSAGMSQPPNEGKEPRQRTDIDSGDLTFIDSMKKNMAQNVTSYVWQTGSQQAKKAFSVYGNIDLFRPYFDVEPHEVRDRLLRSLIPSMPTMEQRQKVPRELYGPTMLIFTLIALLLFQMKTGGHTVQEGTLMGTAFGTCFGYWFFVSGFVWFLSYVCNTHIAMLQLLCLVGYALFGHCIVLLVTTIIHTSHDHLFFYLMWGIIGGLSSLKLISVLVSRTNGQTQKLVVCGAIAVLHMGFLLYLHFAYHQIVEDLNSVIEGAGGAPNPQAVDGNFHINQDTVKKMIEKNVNNLVPHLKTHVTPDKLHQVVHVTAASIQNKVKNDGLPVALPDNYVSAKVYPNGPHNGTLQKHDLVKNKQSVESQSQFIMKNTWKVKQQKSIVTEVTKSEHVFNKIQQQPGNSLLRAIADNQPNN